MSLGITHFAIGAGMTTLLVTLVVPRARYPRTLVLVGGVWAMIPDFYLLSPVAREQLYHFHRESVVMELFWFHRTIDTLDAGKSIPLAAGTVAFFLTVTAVADRRDYRRPERLRSGHGSESRLDWKRDP
jgi:hypothetical protein